MRKLTTIIISILFLMCACDDSYTVHFYVRNVSEDMVYYFSTDHIHFCAHKNSLDSLNVSEVLEGEITSDDETWLSHLNVFVYIFKKSTLDKYSVEEIESKKIYDTLYVFNGLDCKNNKNNNVVFTGE
mgnify:FL=1